MKRVLTRKSAAVAIFILFCWTADIFAQNTIPRAIPGRSYFTINHETFFTGEDPPQRDLIDFSSRNTIIRILYYFEGSLTPPDQRELYKSSKTDGYSVFLKSWSNYFMIGAGEVSQKFIYETLDDQGGVIQSTEIIAKANVFSLMLYFESKPFFAVIDPNFAIGGFAGFGEILCGDKCAENYSPADNEQSYVYGVTFLFGDTFLKYFEWTAGLYYFIEKELKLNNIPQNNQEDLTFKMGSEAYLLGIGFRW